MSKLNVDTIEPEGASTTLTLGASGDTVTIPSGATIDASAATATGFAAGLNSVQTFTSSGTWTRPAGITKVIMEVQGAGGSGSAHASTASLIGGGSGGGYARKLLDVSSISTSTITVGAGGAGVTGAVGNAGGLSKWADGSNNIIGNGGNGATHASYNCVVGGTATGGDVNIQGGTGTWFNYTKTTGGNSILGLGGCGGYNVVADSDPTGYGGGSGGCYVIATAAGTGGIVIVWEYK